jgi:hypothetical protein
MLMWVDCADNHRPVVLAQTEHAGRPKVSLELTASTACTAKVYCCRASRLTTVLMGAVHL